MSGKYDHVDVLILETYKHLRRESDKLEDSVLPCQVSSPRTLLHISKLTPFAERRSILLLFHHDFV